MVQAPVERVELKVRRKFNELTEACVNNSLPQTNAAPRGAQASCLQITEKIKAKTRRL